MLSVVPTPVTVRAPAKVNLHLGVGELRPDGYHELRTVFQALSLREELELVPATALSIKVRGEGARDVPTDARNLVWKAATRLAYKAGREPDVEISIDKGIPVAGGLAGGSADAAATLVGLNELWNLGLTRDELAEVAAELGSDVPFALHGGTAIGTGRGEKLLPVLSRDSFSWVLAFAKGGLSTPEVFRELDRLRGQGQPPRLGEAQELLHALAAGDPSRLAPLSATTCRPRRCRYAPNCAAPCAPASPRARSRASSRVQDRHARSCVPTMTPPSTSAPNSPAPVSAARSGSPPARSRAPTSSKSPDHREWG